EVEVAEVVAVPVEVRPSAVVEDADDGVEIGPPANSPIPIDTTANRLGLSRHRKSRLRALPTPPPPPAAPTRTPARGSGKSATRKAAAGRRSSRGKKAAQESED